jgi:hypothetical protein
MNVCNKKEIIKPNCKKKLQNNFREYVLLRTSVQYICTFLACYFGRKYYLQSICVRYKPVLNRFPCNFFGMIDV